MSKQNPSPAFILNRLGKGNALLLNFFPQGFALPDDQSAGAVQDRWFRLGGAMLKLAGVSPFAQVMARGKPLKFFDVNRFRRGTAWYVAVLRYPDEIADHVISTSGSAHTPRSAPSTHDPDLVSIKLPAKGHVYEIRSHRYLGRNDMVNDSFKTGDRKEAVKVYAILPYSIRALRLTAPHKVKRGAVIDSTVEVLGANGAADHVLRVEVSNPQGRLPEAYQKKTLALKGKCQVRLPIALNDALGTWTIKATDIISGKEACAKVQVVK